MPQHPHDPTTDMQSGGGYPLPPGSDEVQITTFSATPASVNAGETVTVSWGVSVPSTMKNVRFELNAQVAGGPPTVQHVGAHGALKFQPIEATTYTLTVWLSSTARMMASRSVTVNAAVCGDGAPKTIEVDIAFPLKFGIFDKFRSDRFFTLVAPGATVRVSVARVDDTTVTLDRSKGWLKLDTLLAFSVDNIPGEGSMSPSIWFSLVVRNGVVGVHVEHIEPNISPPWGIWLPAIIDPALVGSILGVLKNLVDRLANTDLGADALLGPAVASLFGNRVRSVRIADVADATGELFPSVIPVVCPGSLAVAPGVP